jgi:hypothetical protein
MRCTPVVNKWTMGPAQLPALVAVRVWRCCLGIVGLGVVLLIVPVLAKEVPLLRDQVPALL